MAEVISAEINIIEEKSIKNPNYDLDNSAKEYLKDSEPFKNLIEKIKWTFNDFAVHAAENPNIVKKKFAKNQQSSIYGIQHI